MVEPQQPNKKAKPEPSDQRADAKNPNNPAHDKAEGNRGKQKNPNQDTGKAKK